MGNHKVTIPVNKRQHPAAETNSTPARKTPAREKQKIIYFISS